MHFQFVWWKHSHLWIQNWCQAKIWNSWLAIIISLNLQMVLNLNTSNWFVPLLKARIKWVVCKVLTAETHYYLTGSATFRDWVKSFLCSSNNYSSTKQLCCHSPTLQGNNAEMNGCRIVLGCRSVLIISWCANFRWKNWSRERRKRNLEEDEDLGGVPPRLRRVKLLLDFALVHPISLPWILPASWNPKSSFLCSPYSLINYSLPQTPDTHVILGG